MHSAELLRQIIDEVRPQLEALGEKAAAHKSSPDSWSPKEVLGHLIDSAVNNHLRFVRAVRQDNLVFEGYDQDHWVSIQQYQERRWTDLISFWHQYNVHLAHVMRAIPDEVRDRIHTKHNLHKIAMRAVPTYSPISLAYLMRDYVWHLEHHLAQILPGYARKLHW